MAGKFLESPWFELRVYRPDINGEFKYLITLIIVIIPNNDNDSVQCPQQPVREVVLRGFGTHPRTRGHLTDFNTFCVIRQERLDAAAADDDHYRGASEEGRKCADQVRNCRVLVVCAP